MKRVFAITILEECSCNKGYTFNTTMVGEVTVGGGTLQEAANKAIKLAKEKYEVIHPMIGSIECVEGFFNENIVQGELE